MGGGGKIEAGGWKKFFIRQLPRVDGLGLASSAGLQVDRSTGLRGKGATGGMLIWRSEMESMGVERPKRG